MKLATTTGDFYGYTHSQIKALEHIRAAGFKYADYSFGAEYRDRTGALVFIVSHSMEDMARVADKLLVMNGGRLSMFDTVKKVFSNPKKLKEIGLNVPQVTKVFSALKEKGIPVDENVFTVNDAVSYLLSFLKGGKSND